MGHPRTTRRTAGFEQARVRLPRRVYDAEQHAVAQRLDQEENAWVIWYGAWSRRFFAVPLWPVRQTPEPLILHAARPDDLTHLMRQAERDHHDPHQRTRP